MPVGGENVGNVPLGGGVIMEAAEAGSTGSVDPVEVPGAPAEAWKPSSASVVKLRLTQCTENYREACSTYQVSCISLAIAFCTA